MDVWKSPHDEIISAEIE
jgi:hypothetical protein